MTMDAETMLTTTRAVRRRLDLKRPVPRALIEECVAIAAQAPSGGNRRAFRFVVIDDEQRRGDLAAIYRRAFDVYREGQTVATKAFEGDPVRTAVQERVFRSVEYLAENLHRVPVHVIPVMAGRCEERTNARSQAALWASSVPAIWSFMLAGRLRGLGTALTTMHLEFEREAADLLGIPFEQFTQLALLPLAYTTGDTFKPAEREPASFFIRWNDFAAEPEGSR
jgi:nitroreductase